VRLWAVYDAVHADADVVGDREGLRALAVAVSQAEALDIVLDAAPDEWVQHGLPLDSIRIEPRDEGECRIAFSAAESTLLIAGAPAELTRIIGSPLTTLASGPESKNGVRAHVHLDPTTDPEGRYYAPESASLVVGFAPTP